MSTDTMKKAKVESILISQPEPEQRSPYFTLAKKYKVAVDFSPFIEVEGVTIKEFRKQRININHFPAVIFTSRNAMDHYFRLCEEMRVTVSQETKYFCVSEAIALYLQKHIQYRKRKVFYGNGSMQEFYALITKHKATGRFLYPCTDTRKNTIPEYLKENDFDFKEAILYRTVPTDLSQIAISDYDLLVFFSPNGVESLFKNFPDFKQGKTRIAAYGSATAQEIEKRKLKITIAAPIPETKSMSMAIEMYLKSLV